MKTILAPLDFSGASAPVVTEAAALARAVDGRVVLMAVVQPPVITSEYAPLLDNLTEIVAAGEKAAARNLAQCAEKLRAESIAVDTVLRGGAPAVQILEQARETAPDYIVMGSHGHTALYDLLVGSTTHGVVKRAPCPVVIVPPADRESHRAPRTERGASKRRLRAAGAR